MIDVTRFEAELINTFSYDPETGRFTRLVGNGNIAAGVRGDSKGKGGYRRLIMNRNHFQAHRVAWWMRHGYWPKGVIDHINRDPSDNRIENLRDVTMSENSINRVRNKENGLPMGVSFEPHGSKFAARIYKDGKQYRLGMFENEHLAYAAYVGAARVLFGDFAGV